MNYLGIDIGGTKTSICVANSAGQILDKTKFPTLKNDQVDSFIHEIIAVSKRYVLDYNIQSIGLSAPGPLSVKEKKFLYPPNLQGWSNLPIAAILEETLERPLHFNNDANAAALAEYYFGQFKGCSDLIYLTTSTGMGGGIIAEGRLIQGATDTAGEVGHMPVDIHTEQSTGGIKGSWESYCGGYAFAQHIKRILQAEKTQSLLSSYPLEQITMHEILDAVKKNDAFAMREFQIFIDRLAQGIAILIMTLNPKVIILGTIAMQAKETLLIPLKKALAPLCWKEPLEVVKIAPSSLENIGDLGAISLCLYGKQL